MVFTTNKHPKRWGDALHDDDLAEAIVDRILERGRLLRLDGPSVRTKHLPGDEPADDDHNDRRAAKFPERRPRSFRTHSYCHLSVSLSGSLSVSLSLSLSLRARARARA